MIANVRAATADDRSLIVRVLGDSWGGTTVAAHGVLFDASTLPALLAEADSSVAGLLTYHQSADGMEIVTIDALVRQAGIGTALLDAAAKIARTAGARRLWLITTNDNLDALRFYQRRGFRIIGVASMDAARRLKPSIPLIGDYGIEIHNELTLELPLTHPPSQISKSSPPGRQTPGDRPKVS